MSFRQINNCSACILDVLVNQTTQAITVADLDGNYLFVNPAFCEMVGYCENELLQMTVFDMKIPEQSHSSFEQIKASKEKLAVHVLLQRKDKSVFIAEVVGTNITCNNIKYVLGTIQDVSKRVATEQALINNEQRNKMIMKIANDGIWDWHVDEELVIYDERYYTMAGYSNQEFPYLFDEWTKRIHPDDVKQVTNSFNAYLTGKTTHYDAEFRFLCKNKTYLWIRGKGKIVSYNKQGKPLRFIGTHSDISIQKEHEEKILHQAHFDSLTSLPNRFLSLDRLRHACEEAKRNNELVALLFLDLDDFKKINDTLGHDIGDELLKEAAKRLRSVVRSIDTVGRLGGDEFIVILGGLKIIKEAHPIVENLLKKFREVFVINNRELMLTASIGISIFPNDATDTSELLRNADSAMYGAKYEGRNTYSYYTEEMNKTAQRRLAIEEQLHRALAKNEFTVYYQPKIELSTSKVIGTEALLRWKNPILGDVPPDEFISIAEQTGIIVTLGQFVLQQALKQTTLWQKSFDKNFQISINLSPRQFRDSQLINFIKTCIVNSGISAGSLELEITEGVLLTGQNYVNHVLTSINNLGGKMAMDDFGTGYSSLSHLRTYPFDALKIDRRFINKISITPKDKELITAVISMSHALNIKVVAEGIETQDQFEQLQKLGCDYGQGYFFSKPLPADKMTAFINKH
ncbi:MAG: EAL domain-containing protein [Colwellia sp.]